MKKQSRSHLKRAVAFVAALTIVATTTAFTKADANKREVTNYADDYTSLFPGLTDTKLKLSDPVFTEKDWYEYVEYVFYTDVQDGDMIYRIYQPDDYALASIMAIGDYNPNDITGNQTNLSMNLGELQGIFDIAAQGSSISKEFAGLDVVSGIAETMNNIGEVMDNSKYYSSSSFLGIPNDTKYSGVSNNGFFNADSLEITIEESVTVSACKTVAMDSGYSISETNTLSKDYSEYREASNSTGTSTECAVTSGVALSNATSISSEISSSISNAIGWEIVKERSTSQTDSTTSSSSIESGVEVGVEGLSASLSATIGSENEHSNTVSDTLSVGESGSFTSEVGSSIATSSEQSVTSNVENSQSSSSSIENSLTNGTNSTSGQEHAKDVAVDIGYGVDYQYGNEYGKSIGVTRVFNAREEEEVKNVGWKLCEYVVKVPYYIEAIQTDSSGNENVLYGQYVNYNLLNGVSRVFANGYIEHWYTGELVTYADFFEGFITANELVDMAKEQAASGIEMGGE